MGAKLNYNQIIIDASNRFNAIVNACMNSKDYNTIIGLTCASLYGGEDTMPYEKEQEQDSIIRYQYNGGGCFFIVDGIKVDVFDLRDMRDNTSCVDVCVLSISYTDPDGNYMYHIIPDAWLYGSTSDEFNEGMEVHPQFIKAASDFIKIHHITKELQEVQ